MARVTVRVYEFGMLIVFSFISNFSEFLVFLLFMKKYFQKGVFSKRGEFACMGANSFLSELTNHSKMVHSQREEFAPWEQILYFHSRPSLKREEKIEVAELIH